MRLLLSVAGALAALGCAGGELGRATAGSGGTLVIVSPGDPDVLLPTVTATTTGTHISDLLFPRLAELTQSLNTVDDSGFVPLLASAWQRRGPTSLAFRLDPRARWQDGSPITAADVVFTFELYRDPAVNAPLKANLDGLDRVEAEDSGTVVFYFRRAYPEQLYDATYHMRIVPKHLLDTIPRARLAAAAFSRAPVGAGPFRLVRWRRGEEVVLEADSGWFLGRPRLGRLIWRIVPDVPAGVTMLLSGQADAMEAIPQRDQIERVAGDTVIRLVPYPSPFLGGIAFNLRRPLFADREVRRALAMSVDRATVVRSVFGPWADVPVGATTDMQWIAREPVDQLPFDPAEAVRLLEARGWRDADGDGVREKAGAPLRFSLLVPTTSRVRQQAAVLVKEQLRRVGADVVVQPIEFTVMEQRSYAGNFDAAFFSRTLDPSPSNLLQFWSSEAVGRSNIGAYASARFDSLVRAATGAPTRSAAAPAYREALELLNHDAPAVFLYAPRNQAAVHRRFEGVSIRPDSWLATVASWHVPVSRRLPRDRPAADP